MIDAVLLDLRDRERSLARYPAIRPAFKLVRMHVKARFLATPTQIRMVCMPRKVYWRNTFAEIIEYIP